MVLLTKQKIEIFTFNNWWDPTSISSIYIIIYRQHIFIYIYICIINGSEMIQMMLHVFLLLSFWSVYSFNMFQQVSTHANSFNDWRSHSNIPEKSARKPAKSYSSKISQKQTLTRRDKQPLDHSTYLLLHLPREFRSLESTRALWLLFNSTFNPSSQKNNQKSVAKPKLCAENHLPTPPFFLGTANMF